jgi:3',5'-cyclic AMP phosphodiesterase CpdA
MVFMKRTVRHLCSALGIGCCLLAGMNLFPAHAGHAVRDWNATQLSRLPAAPAGGEFSFAVLGDSQSHFSILAHHLAQIRQAGQLDFTVSVGDQVAPPERAEFEKFFSLADDLADRPLLTVRGNHDASADYLYEHFAGAPYYSFQYRGAYFIVLDDANLTALGSAQWRWLERELRAAEPFKTRLVFMHAPPFDPRDPLVEVAGHGLPEAEGRRLVELFKRHRVDHVFSGHIHSYYAGDWDGVPYTISGGGGARLVGSDPDHAFYHYLRVTVKADGAVAVAPQRVALAGLPLMGSLAAKTWARFDGLLWMRGHEIGLLLVAALMFSGA